MGGATHASIQWGGGMLAHVQGRGYFRKGGGVTHAHRRGATLGERGGATGACAGEGGATLEYRVGGGDDAHV